MVHVADPVRITEIRCLWHGSFHTKTVEVILIREPDDDFGHGLALVATGLAIPVFEEARERVARDVTDSPARSS